jgi:perosamine synthetase
MKYKMAAPYFPEDEISWILEEYKGILQGKAMLSMGKRVKEFEKNFSKYIGSKYSIGTNSCTAALEIALRCCDIRLGDEVIIPAETFIATGSAVVMEGGVPIFCDISPDTFCISLDTLKERITKKTKAVIMVHMGGMISPDALEIKILCNENNIILIEDAAHAIGASINGISAGNIGDFGCFSFYSTKIMTTAEGGMLVCSDDEFYQKANSFRNRGRDMQGISEVYSRLGSNNRMTEFTALLGISQLKVVDSFLKNRGVIASTYNKKIKQSNISDAVKFVNVPENIRHSYWRYLIRLDASIDREIIKKELADNDIESDWAYYPALHLQPYFIENHDTYKGLCPIAEYSLDCNMCLPINSTMKKEDALFIIEIFILAIQRQL